MARYVILSEIAFTERDWQRFGCADFAALGYEVVPIQLDRALRVGAPTGTPNERVVALENLAALDRLLARARGDDIVMVEARLSPTTLPLFRLLRKHRIRYAVVELGMLPLFCMRNRRAALSSAEYVTLRLEDLGGVLHRWRRLLGQMFANRFEYFRLQPPALWLTAGTAASALTSGLPRVWKARRLAVASFDHVAAVTLCTQSSAAGATAVFLDEAFPDHPDYGILGLRPPVTADRYWRSLENLFREIESKTGLTVVVAPHPKARGLVPAPIRVRLADIGRTAELVRRSSLVLCHASTAVSFPVLFRKPLLFITTDEIERSPYRGAIARMSSWFDLRRINADRFRPDELTIPPVDERLYRAYEHAFLRAPSAEDASPWEVLRATFAASPL